MVRISAISRQTTTVAVPRVGRGSRRRGRADRSITAREVRCYPREVQQREQLDLPSPGVTDALEPTQQV